MEDLSPTENPVLPRSLGERPGLTILLSGVFGFFLFALVFPTLKDNVESAQVVAGIVSYPPGNPMGTYHLSALSLLIDSAALLLKLGLSEWTVCAIFSGLEGFLFFSGITALTLAFSRSAAVSLALPVLLLHLSINSPVPFRGPPFLETFNAHAYPIFTVGQTYIYGTVGLFAALLVLGLLANGKLKAGGFLAGLMAWVHPSMGLGCWAASATGIYLRRESYGREELKGVIRWFAGGVAISALGMGAHKIFLAPATGTVDWDLANRIVENFERSWDVHRVFDSAAVAPMLEVDLYVVLLFLALRLFAWKNLTEGARFLLCGLLAVTIAGAAALAVQGYFPEAMPGFVRTFMVHRWLNINSMMFPVIVFGLLGYWGLKERLPLALGFLLVNAALVAALVTDSLTWSSQFGYPQNPGPAWKGLIFPVLGGLQVLILAAALFRHEGKGVLRAPRQASMLGAGAIAAIAIFIVSARIIPYFDREKLAGRDQMAPFFEELAKGEGLLLLSHPSGIRFPLLTRRGVLIDPEQIDIFTYAKSAAPAMEEIFQRIYGRTLLRPRHPSEQILIYEHLTPAGWEGFSMADWQGIKRDYGVTDVIVPFEYPLRLPLLAVLGPYFFAYHIPEL